MVDDFKGQLRDYLQRGRDSLLWKLEGLGEYDIRRPLVPTGTNLLGLVKHVASVEAGYLGDTFGRPFPEALPWMEDGADVNGDMWVTPEESREDVVGLYRRVWAHGDATIAALELDAPGRVPWWKPEAADVTLHRVLVHLIAETDRHCGHADILRELIDGAAGVRADSSNLAFGTAAEFKDFHDRIERAARDAAA